MTHPSTGVIIVDHGSRRDEANRMLVQFVELFAKHNSYHIVEPAHMEIVEPSIETAFDRCVKRGATLVVVTPYLLSPGRHWDQDIHQLAAAAAAKYKGVTHCVTQPIGLHPLMLEVVGSRIEQSLAGLKRL